MSLEGIQETLRKLKEQERVYCPTNSKDESITGNAAPIQVVRIDLGKETLAIVLVLAIVIGSCGVVMGLNLSRQRDMEDHFDDLRRQYRMTELKLDDWTVVAHRSRLVLPGDYARGPQGNLDSESFTKPKGK